MSRHRLIQSLCWLIVLMVVPLASFAEGSVVTTTDVTLQGDANGTGCAIWLEPAEPIRFGVLVPPIRSEDRLVSREFSLRVVNGQAVATSSCVVTTGGASFQWNELEVRSVHALKLSKSPTSGLSVRQVPQVNEMADGELQSILVQSPSASGCAIVLATLDLSSLGLLRADAIVRGTLTLTMSDTAP